MIRKDWSVIRITILLYFIVFLLPLNYYFTKESFDSMKNDATTMRHLVFINGAVPSLATIDNINDRDLIIKKIDSSLNKIEHDRKFKSQIFKQNNCDDSE